MGKFKLKFYKQTIKRNLASMLGSIIMVTSCIPAYMIASEPETVKAAGEVSGGNVKGENYSGTYISFDYGTKFASESELRKYLVSEVKDEEDGTIDSSFCNNSP